MPRKISVEIVGDSRSLERAFQRSSRSATKFNSDISKMSRGIAAGSGLFQTFGRSLAFASGGFLAFGSATAFLRESVDQARQAQVAQRSLAAQMKASGQSFEANRARIEELAVSYGKFGFEDDEVIKGLTVLVRGTGDITKAMRLSLLTADLARAKNIQYADAANTLAKVFGGQETALRRAVPGLQKNAHGWDLIQQAQKRLAGQAAANTTSAERFHAALVNTQQIIGTALLPTLDRYLDSLSEWLNKTENQKKIQKDTNEIVGTAASVLTALGEALGFVGSAWDALPDFGKDKGLLELLGIIKRGGPRGDLAPGVTGRGGGGEFGFPPGGPTTGGGRRPPRPLSLGGRFNLADLRLAQARLTAISSDDLRILTVEKGILEQQIAQTKNLKEKTALTERLAGVTSEIRGIEQDTTDTYKQQNQALKDRAQAIKAAIIDRLQRRQTGIENRRELRDALNQLRTARLLGGPIGIRLARERVADARFQQRLATLSAAPATLTGGGTFRLGGQIVINVHGTTDPDKVAAKVVAIIQRRTRHTATQSRGPTAGIVAGPH